MRTIRGDQSCAVCGQRIIAHVFARKYSKPGPIENSIPDGPLSVASGRVLYGPLYPESNHPFVLPKASRRK